MQNTLAKTPETLSDEALDKIVGGLNPQPLPPRWAYSAYYRPNPYASYSSIGGFVIGG